MLCVNMPPPPGHKQLEMPFKAELNAISRTYVKLMKLPVKDMLLALTKVLPIIEKLFV